MKALLQGGLANHKVASSRDGKGGNVKESFFKNRVHSLRESDGGVNLTIRESSSHLCTAGWLSNKEEGKRIGFWTGPDFRCMKVICRQYNEY